MVAGEASGDLLAALLIGGLRERWPQLALQGIGGPRMTALGFDAWWPQERLAVRGYVEVLRHYRALSRLRQDLGTRLIAERPRAFIGVDAPDFNLDLEARLKAAGIPTVHFVCPSIWAWRGGRAKRMAESCDHVLCLFPFEPALLAAHGVAATYVGHPLADAIPLEPPRAQARAALGLAADDTVVAVLPGSRRSEITAIAPVFLQAALRLQRERPGLRFVLPVAPGLGPLVREQLQQHAPRLGLTLLDGRSHEALAACDVTLIASGTATLEAALFKRPMVIGYRMHPISWQIMKRLRYQPWVGLPNILSREFVVPELIQGDCTPEALAAATARWLDDPAAAQAVSARFTDIHHTLRCDTARRATDALAQLIGAA
ncbi:MAG: lipid-A-disaccharide synthase [Rubrivivax sp.]|nr:lipid-A-disaccharide synthase [Rubrivivax sp.]